MTKQMSGQVTVLTAGVNVAGPVEPVGSAWALKAHPDNAGAVWIGHDGAGGVSAVTGFPLSAGEGVIVRAYSLSALRIDADVSGDKLCWLRLG